MLSENLQLKTRNGLPWVALKDCIFSSDSKVTIHSQDWHIGQKDPGSGPWLDIMSDRSCLLLPRLCVSHFTEIFYKLCSSCHWPVSAAFCPQLHPIMSDTFQRAMSNCSKFIVTTCFFVCFWLVIMIFFLVRGNENNPRVIKVHSGSLKLSLAETFIILWILIHISDLYFRIYWTYYDKRL